MELMGHDEFVQSLKEKVELDSLEDQLGSFTNRGIDVPLSNPLPSLAAMPA